MTTIKAVPVHSSNAEQLKAWDGDEGAYWAAHADSFDRAVAPYHHKLLAAAAIGTSERVLDIGCGTGQTTRDAARAAQAGSALGVDLSSQMIDFARRQAASEGVANAFFEQADAQIHPFRPGTFDIAISRTGATFFGDLVSAFTNIGKALRPDGRLVLATCQPIPRNEWIREFTGALAVGRDLPTPPADAPGPFALSDPDRVRAVLTDAGFVDIELEGATAGMWFGDDADDAHQFVLGLLGWMLEDFDEAGRTRGIEALRASTGAHAGADGVIYESGAWTIRATRR
jgi:SAM-dependent methyltransferase